MTMGQMARGLTDVLVIEEPANSGFDADKVINLRDFRLNDDGRFLPGFTGHGAARGGALGNLHTTNWQTQPTYDHAAGSLLRLRVVNTDMARIQGNCMRNKRDDKWSDF